jgi:CheY-like chemotaxis protein
MDLSRVNKGLIELKRERTDLRTVLVQALEAIRPMADQKGHALALDQGPVSLWVDGDSSRLVQVFTNLISNAAKYSERGSPIWLSSEVTEDQIIVSVKDQGIGIPAAMLPQIFDMFVQVDRSLERSQGGLGIGLTLVKRLVELHGGSVMAHSGGEGQGSEFVVRLPRVRSLPAEEVAATEDGKSTQRLRVLIADDNEDAAESLVQLLAMMGNTVHRAANGLQAVELAEHLRPEVIVLDIGMPGLNGFEACRRIRAQPWSQGVVMIALTGWGQDDDRRRSTDAGFDRHLVKPVDPLMLEKLMSDLR